MPAINSRPIASRGRASFMVVAAFVILKRTTNGPRDKGPSESVSMPSPTPMDRRDFLKLAGAAAAAGPLAGQTQMPGPMTPA
ncbi:MAG TPA: twin-arginine translocation signal domain-containing protein, partial [Bryobacteraceae bacterium]|nr:twin-arginine translocation signal domain-containing protein [Bryobacteraceae bacterium]